MGNLCSSQNNKTVILDDNLPVKKINGPTTTVNVSSNKKITMNKIDLSKVDNPAQKRNRPVLESESSDDDSDGSGRAQIQYE